MNRGRRLFPVACLVTVLLAGCGAGHSPAATPETRAAHSTAGPGKGVAPPAASNVTRICGDVDVASSLGPELNLKANITQLTPAVTGLNYDVTARGIEVDNGSRLISYSLPGVPGSSFALPSEFTGADGSGISGPFVDPAGNIWLSSSSGGQITKFSPGGQVLWSSRAYGPSDIYGFASAHGYQVGVVSHNASRTEVLNDSGARVASLPFALSGYVSQTPDGDLLVSSDGYVSTYSLSGKQLARFGSSETADAASYSGAPYHFYYQGSALQPSAKGPIYTIDPLDTIEETMPSGYLEATTDLNGALKMSQIGKAFIVKGRLYFVTGPAFGSAYQVSSLPFADVRAFLAAPGATPESLGWGAGVTSGRPGDRVAGNYFPDGATPTFYADFDDWWLTHDANVHLSYSVWTDADMRSGEYPAPTSVPLPRNARALSDVRLVVPAADRAPGPYELQVSLWQGVGQQSELLGATCAPFSVGPPGARLKLSKLPGGAGFGGPSDPRGVALNSELGLNGFRGAAIDWSTLLPNCNATAPTEAACGPSAVNFADAPQSYFEAAYLARRDHVTYWVQVSTGDNISKALVAQGWWGEDVGALVAYYDKTSDCNAQHCAPVTDWEAWNEANNTFSDSGGHFVSEILKPFYQAVKRVAPADTVIGGSSLGVAVPWWQQVVAAGGLSYMDVAGVHPYTSYNDSWEEDGTIAQVEQLQKIVRSTPIWFTEVGWWSNGPYDFLNQADIVARAMLWQAALHIPVWNYFYDEGGWGNDNVSFSLIQYENTDDYVKPAALATMVEAQQVAGRSYLSSPSTGVPYAYRTDFGPKEHGSTDLSAVWLDGLSTQTEIAISGPRRSVTVTDQWGVAHRYALSPGKYYALPINDQVTYITYSAVDKLSVRPVQSFGADLALVGKPTASSSARGARPADATTGDGVGGWSPAAADAEPIFTVALHRPAPIDRVIVDMHSLGSIEGNARDFTVSVEQRDGTWRQVAKVVGAFYNHTVEVQFATVQAVAVRLTVEVGNFGGSEGGGVPAWWSPTTPLHIQLHSLSIYQSAPTHNPPPLPGPSI